MKNLYTILCLCVFAYHAQAQAPVPAPTTEPYGKVDMADMEMRSCDFEKDANAEVLFDKGVISASHSLILERHLRIKIFTDRGTQKGDFRLRVQNDGFGNPVSDLEAETFNLVNGKIEITPFDKKTVYFTTIDRQTKQLAFALPNVKPGSIIEIKYVSTQLPYAWFFQDYIPTRYSELETDYLGKANVRTVQHVRLPFATTSGKTDDDKRVRAMVNVHSLPTELYMTSAKDNLERIELFNNDMLLHTWDGIGKALLGFDHFGSEFEQGLSGEGAIMKHVKTLKPGDEQIAFIFDTVKNTMKWNGETAFFALDAITKAWNKKTGNSAEINLILYNLLKRAGINAFPMVISTRENGRMSPANPNPYVFNNTVVYIPVDSAKYYVLDATDRNGLFNTIPYDDLNSFGLAVNVDKLKTFMVPIEDDAPVTQSIFVNAEIKPEGKLSGTAEITSDSYNKINAVTDYKAKGEEKYIKEWLKADNVLKISGFKIENMDVDSLPLTQKIDFSADLAGSDETYIYINPNLLPLIEENPFKGENRFSDIDFGYRDNFSLSATYKLPAGFKTDALPKNITMMMPDKSLSFKRLVAEDNGTIIVRYSINHIKTVYFTEDYQDLRGFYKKLYELLNEQIILKKG